MLIFPLKKEWYEKIKSGEKTIEYREVKPYWTKRLYTEMCTRLENEYGYCAKKRLPDFDNFIKLFVSEKVLFGDGSEHNPVIWDCKLRLGYTNKYMTANITKIEIVDGKDTDLHIDKPVYAIHLSNIREKTE